MEKDEKDSWVLYTNYEKNHKKFSVYKDLFETVPEIVHLELHFLKNKYRYRLKY